MMTAEQQAYKAIDDYYRFNYRLKYGKTIIWFIDFLKVALAKIDIVAEHNIGIGMTDLHYLMREKHEDSDYIAFHMQESLFIDEQLESKSDVIKIHWCYSSYDIFEKIKKVVVPSYVKIYCNDPSQKIIMLIALKQIRV